MILCTAISMPIRSPGKQSMEDLYRGKDGGYCITDIERDLIVQSGGDPTYGEVVYDTVRYLIQELKPTSRDVFYDLGSGVGKMVVQMYLESPVKKSCGIELSATRHACAEGVKAELKSQKLLDKKRALVFIKGDFLQQNFSDATIVFMNSLCFSEEVMRSILKKLARGKNHMRVLSSQRFPDDTPFVFKKTYSWPMSWSLSTDVHLYELVK